MNYIGSKNKLSDFIFSTITKQVGTPLLDLTFCDLFAGTGIVGRKFKTHVKEVLANDTEYYSFVLNRNYIGNHKSFQFQSLIDKLNDLEGTAGFIFKEFSQGGSANRNYFTSANGKKIDAIRQTITIWKNEKKINTDTYYFLLASLLESADKVANTASVYGAFLKHIKKTAQKELVVKPALFIETENTHKVFQEDANTLIKKIKGDILYLDPPYNARQYGANYHVLNTIAKYNTFVPKGKTGLPDYYKSAYCRKGTVEKSFFELLKNAQFKYIFLSYNNEGLMSEETVKNIMKQFGTYHLETIDYQRFKADKTKNRNHKATRTKEYLHILKKK
jgi:adenine-specific DNA-methyltransferase